MLLHGAFILHTAPSGASILPGARVRYMDEFEPRVSCLQGLDMAATLAEAVPVVGGVATFFRRKAEGRLKGMYSKLNKGKK